MFDERMMMADPFVGMAMHAAATVGNVEGAHGESTAGGGHMYEISLGASLCLTKINHRHHNPHHRSLGAHLPGG